MNLPGGLERSEIQGRIFDSSVGLLVGGLHFKSAENKYILLPERTLKVRILKLRTLITYNMRNIYAKFQNSRSSRFGEHQL